MKTNKYLVLLITLLTLIGCSDDDFSREYIDDEAKTNLIGQLQLSREAAAPNTNLAFTVTIPQNFSVESTVEITGIFKTPDADLTQIKAFATIPAGSTVGEGEIEMPNIAGPGNFSGTPDAISFSITGIALDQSSDGGVDDPFTMTSDSASIRLIDYDANWMRILSNRSLAYSFDWQNPADNDLDIYLVNLDTFDFWESSESGSRWEGDYIDDNRPDGPYGLYVGAFQTTGEDIPYSIHCLRNDNSIDYYTGVFSSPQSGDFLGPILLLNKTTDADGNAYITTSLP